MNTIEETTKSLERIELLLKSIDYQLAKLINIASTKEVPECTTPKRDPAVVPEMITLKEASRRTGLSYYYLRNECLKGNIVSIQIGNGKWLINFDRLIEQMESSHGSIQLNKMKEG